MIEKIVSDFISNHEVDEESFPVNTSAMKQDKSVAKKREVYLRIPFVGRPSSKLQRRIQDTLETDDLQVKTAFSTTKVGEYFNLKSRCSRLFAANVVYRFTCSRDSSITYIGETTRQLFERITDHRGKDGKSAVLGHLQECTHCQDSTNISTAFDILQRCSPSNIGSAEAILISKYCPSLNTQLGPWKGTMVSLSLY
jgi:hypothetical protein